MSEKADQRMEARLEKTDQKFEARFGKLDDRFDRLIWALMGVGGVSIAGSLGITGRPIAVLLS